MSRPKTIFCDLDGTLTEHPNSGDNDITRYDLEQNMKVLPGTKEKLWEWDGKGYNIILMTGRKESLRFNTEKQLSDIGIFYDKLIMGVGGGPRIIINDNKPDGNETAFAYSLERNQGISNLDI